MKITGQKKYIAVKHNNTVIEVQGFKEALSIAAPGAVLYLRVYNLTPYGLSMNDMREIEIGSAGLVTIEDYYRAYDSII